VVARNALFDTNILIDHLKGIPEAKEELDRYTSRAISVITWMEVLAGAVPANEVAARTLLSAFLVLPITEVIAETTVKIRRTHKLKLPDAIILATAEQTGRVLITRNTRDFDESHPSIRIPYRV
jgi:predicted nucleic acid-binding protein